MRERERERERETQCSKAATVGEGRSMIPRYDSAAPIVPVGLFLSPSP